MDNLESLMDSVQHKDAREFLITLPDKSINSVITSPPYFGQRDYGDDGQIGLEETAQA